MTTAPTVGRVVHYQSRGSADGLYPPEPRAAIITVVHVTTAPNGEDWLGERQYAEERWSEYHNGYVRDEEVAEYITHVGLAVLNPTGLFFDDAVEYSEQPKPGCWSWPPRT